MYFGKDLKDITLAEAAMLAGLPKAPSAYNPVVNPKRAKVRQQYILKRMLDLKYITQAQFDQASAEEIHARVSGTEYSVHAEYVAEMVRQMMYAQFREEAYTRGLNVVTTIDSADQDVAYRSLRKGLMDYERRHGYRGPEAFIDLPSDADEREQAIRGVAGYTQIGRDRDAPMVERLRERGEVLHDRRLVAAAGPDPGRPGLNRLTGSG